MPTIAGIGELSRLEVYRLAGVAVVEAGTDDDVRSAWGALASDTLVVLLTPRAATALGESVAVPGAPMTVVLPS